MRVTLAQFGLPSKSPSEGKNRADGVEADVRATRFGQAAVGDVLVEDADIRRELVFDGDANACPEGEAEAKVLALGVGKSGGVGEDKANAGFEVGDYGQIFLDEIVARTEESTCEPRIGAVGDGGKHAAEEELEITAGPTLITDLV